MTWRNLAPQLCRQRAIIEATTENIVEPNQISRYLLQLAKVTNMEIILDMTNNHRLPNYQPGKRYELVRQASTLLRAAGFSFQGRPLKVEDWQQYQFEASMQRGAYCSNNARRRR
jgi:hypothetical protein